jgi:hypothetical protein
MGKIGVGTPMSDISNLLKLENVEDPIGFLAIQLERELVQRGIPVKCEVGGTENVASLQVHRYQIINYRATSFSPWEACHLFSGTLVAKGERRPIKAFFYNGKTPIWSMNEIAEPCFNTPISILIKEIASKVNKELFDMRASDAKIEELSAAIDAELGNAAEGPFWKVLELGSTNNLIAMEPLKRYAQTGDEFFKSCALSAIGVLGPYRELDFLKQSYRSGGFNDRYMAAKAIGDIDTAEALQFIKDMKIEKSYESEGGFRTVVDLYNP